MKHFIDGDVIGFDTETTGIDVWHGDKPFAFSFANLNGDTKYFEFAVDSFTRQPVIGKDELQSLQKIRALLEDSTVTKVMHNAKFDVRMMEKAYGIYVAGPGGRVIEGGKFHDTMIMAHNCNTLERALGLKQLGDRYCDIDRSDLDSLKKSVQGLRRHVAKMGWKIAWELKAQPSGPPKQVAQTAADYWVPGTLHRMGQLPAKWAGAESLCGKYAVMDAVRTIQLWFLFSSLIEELGVQEINKLEMDLWRVIYGMEDRGVQVCHDTLNQQMQEALKNMKEIYPRLEKIAGKDFRPKASADCRRLFYDILKLPIEKYTPGGARGKPQPSVDKDVIKQNIHIPAVRDLAAWNANYTAYVTFFSKFDALSIPDEACEGKFALHCDYRQVGGDQGGDRGGVATGRVSCSRPNMQNILTPSNSTAVYPVAARNAFVPRPGCVWLCTDYEGMEVRMFAAIAEEPFMMSAIKAGRSIHDEMTNYIWGGKNNPDALHQAIHVLALDGTGMHTSVHVDRLWKEWGITDKNVMSLTPSRKEQLADRWLASHGYDQVKAQSAIGKKVSKSKIKMITFLKIYGGGPPKASRILECEVDEARRILNRYDELFPGVKRYFNDIMHEGRANGYITSKWGRRLAIDPDFAYRATNYMVQGSSADCMKRAMVRIDEWIRRERLDAHLIMTIHDEIVVEVRRELLTRWFVNNVCRLMCDTEGHISIDMAVEPMVVTQNWSEKHHVKV